MANIFLGEGEGLPGYYYYYQGQDQGQGQDQIMRQRSALQQQMVLALVLALSFFNYRVVLDIPSLITSLECIVIGCHLLGVFIHDVFKVFDLLMDFFKLIGHIFIG